jgi:hypothetical protein
MGTLEILLLQLALILIVTRACSFLAIKIHIVPVLGELMAVCSEPNGVRLSAARGSQPFSRHREPPTQRSFPVFLHGINPADVCWRVEIDGQPEENLGGHFPSRWVLWD